MKRQQPCEIGVEGGDLQIEKMAYAKVLGQESPWPEKETQSSPGQPGHQWSNDSVSPHNWH